MCLLTGTAGRIRHCKNTILGCHGHQVSCSVAQCIVLAKRKTDGGRKTKEFELFSPETWFTDDTVMGDNRRISCAYPIGLKDV